MLEINRICTRTVAWHCSLVQVGDVSTMRHHAADMPIYPYIIVMRCSFVVYLCWQCNHRRWANAIRPHRESIIPIRTLPVLAWPAQHLGSTVARRALILQYEWHCQYATSSI